MNVVDSTSFEDWIIDLYCCWQVQSAIGEGMTRRDHSDVSNQV